MQPLHRPHRLSPRAHFLIAFTVAVGFACAPAQGAPVRGAAVAGTAQGKAVTEKAPTETLQPATPAAAVTHVTMRNVHFFVDPKVVLRVRRLSGEMRAVSDGPIVFDDKRSFTIKITSAEVGLASADLTVLLNKYVFGYPGAPLKRLRVSTSGRHLVQKGVLHKLVDIPFEIKAAVEPMPDGWLRLRPLTTRIFGVDGEGLMRALNLTLEKLLDLKGAHGARVSGNNILLYPDSILPPPGIEGRVTAVRIEGDELVQTFGPVAASTPDWSVPPDTVARNYMYYRGGTLRFGKLLMLDADMQIVDLDPGTPFRFDLDRYKQQLVAGYSKSLANGGLEVFMPDIEKATSSDSALSGRIHPR
ncbi:MAG: hypothetical protein H7Z74_12560 [Anaerolineae bacterium]|nr:hypothetical protein [Gemmatimonadaceae bacterium]